MHAHFLHNAALRLIIPRQESLDRDCCEMQESSLSELGITLNTLDSWSSASSCYSSSSDEDSSSTFDLLVNLQDANEQLLFLDHGYRLIDIVDDTVHGHIYRAKRTDSGGEVLIKSGQLKYIKQGISMDKEWTYTVDHNLEMEGEILQKAARYNHPNIVQCIDVFSTTSDVYVVTECVQNSVTMTQWLECIRREHSAHELVPIMKDVMKQLFEAVRFLHQDLQCCHLNICMDNILIQTINDKRRVVLCGFGVAQSFDTKDNFVCDKFRLNIDDEAYVLPDISSEGVYDARHADVWALGRILFECMTGRPLYTTNERWQWDLQADIRPQGKDAFTAILNNSYDKYLANYYSDNEWCDLVCLLLQMNVDKRVNVSQAMQHVWLN